MSENSTDKGEEVEEQTKHTCIICLDRIVDIRLPCGHAVMCETCLRELKHRSNKCPTCRVPFDKYFVLEADDDHHLVRSPSFINPERSIAPFGALRRFSSETTIHNDRPTASAHQAHPTNTRHRISGPDVHTTPTTHHTLTSRTHIHQIASFTSYHITSSRITSHDITHECAVRIADMLCNLRNHIRSGGDLVGFCDLLFLCDER
eukprot:c7697_g1_i1.p1 GENE.c7697_g1_i1~~c7697_g1_i1.p1  ORF type:complete len:215 (-),score=38.48 c7697_g1_i1:535-1149(-)